jgi:hypothetical protein
MVRIQLQTGYLDVKEDTDFPLNFGVADIKDVVSKSGAYSKTITLSGTDNNNQLLGHYYDVNIQAGTFDINVKTTCTVIQNDIPIIRDAYIQLLSINKAQYSDGHEEDVTYSVQITDPFADFATKVGQKELTDIDFTDLIHTYSSANVVASFNNTVTDGYVYPLGIASGNDYYLDECRPAIYAKLYWDRIHAAAGYSYEWTSLSTCKFNKAIIPFNGEYVNGDVQDYTVEATKSSFIPSGTITTWTEILDASGYFNPTTGVFNQDFYLSFQNPVMCTVNVTFDFNLVNATGANVYLIDPNTSGTPYDREWTIKLYAYKTGSIGICQILIGTATWSNADNPLPNGTTTVQTFTGTFTGYFGSISPTDDVTFEVVVQQSPGDYLQWSDSATVPYSNETITTQVDVDTLEIKLTFSASTITFNQPIDVNQFIPKKVKQRDFIKSICTMYNLFVEPSTDDANKLVYKHRDDFYDDGTVKDWTLKLAKDKPQDLKFLPELTKKKILLSYKPDKDSYNTAFTGATNEVYGQVEFTYDNEYVKDVDKKEIIFSPTPMIKTDFNAVVPSFVGSAPKNNIRILIHNGTDTCDPFNVYDYVGSGETNETTYPLISHFDDHYNPAFDINFAVCDYYFYNDIAKTNNNLFNLYWRRTIGQINTGKMLVAYFDLKEGDIQTLKLSDKIRIDNSYWFINKVVDYNANKDQLTKVELMSVDSEIELPPFIRKFTEPIGVGGGNQGLQGLLDQWYAQNKANNSPGKTIVKGIGNVIQQGITAIVLGDNGNITENGIWINGEKVLGEPNEVTSEPFVTIQYNYTVATTEDQIIIIDANSVTVSLPDPAGREGQQIEVKVLDYTGCKISANPELIDDKTSWGFKPWESMRVKSNGTIWMIMSW